MKKTGRLYLVRKNFEKIIGPMPLEKVATGLYHLEYSKSDELSGSLGPWLRMDDAEGLAKHYPELHNKLNPQTDHSFESIKAIPTRVPYTQRKQAKQTNWSLGITLFLGCVALVLLAMKYIPQWRESMNLTAENARYLQKNIESIHKTKGLEGVGKYLEEEERSFIKVGQKYNDFLVFMLPYWRFYGFDYKKDGQVENISAKVLLGSEQNDIPFEDCSLYHWRKTFASDSNSAFTWLRKSIPGKPTSEIITLLLLDRGWMQRRYPKGWISPQNGFIACTQTAFLAWKEFSSKAIRKDALYQVIYDRLLFLAEGTPGANRVRASREGGANLLNFLACLEQAENKSQLNECDQFSLSGPMSVLKTERTLMRMISLVFDNQSQITEEIMISTPGISGFPERDSLALMDLRAEKNFVDLIHEGLSASNASFKTAVTYPDIVF